MGITSSLTTMLQYADIERQDNGLWTVYCDGKNRCGKIYDCGGNDRFEIIEEAYRFINDVKDNINYGKVS